MNCNQAQEWIGPLLDGELSGSDAAELRAHMAGCPGCESERAILAGLEAATDRVYEVPEVDDLAWERVWRGVQQVTEAPAQGERKTRFLPWAAAAAVLVVGVLATTWSLRNGEVAAPNRLAMLQEGAASMEVIDDGSADYFPVVTMTDGGDPVVFVYEAGER